MKTVNTTEDWVMDDWLIITGARGHVKYKAYLKLETLKIFDNIDPYLITRLEDMIASRDNETIDLAIVIMDEILSKPITDIQ